MTQGSSSDRVRRHGEPKREYATSLVRIHGMTVSAAAQEAGISRSTLQRWLDAVPETPTPSGDGSPVNHGSDWTQKRVAVVGAVVAVVTLVAGLVLGPMISSWWSDHSDQKAAVRSAADLVSIESGVRYLRFRGSGDDVPADVVINKNGEAIKDVWVEARGPAGRTVDIDMGSVLGCRYEKIGSVTEQGHRIYTALVVHFTAKGQQWSKTSDGDLEGDKSDIPSTLIARGNHEQGDLRGCG